MNCNEIKKQIPLFLKGMTEKEISIEIEKHLASCIKCQNELELEKNINQGLDAFFNEAGSMSFEISRKNQSKTLSGFFKIAGTIAAVFVISFILFTTLHNGILVNSENKIAETKIVSAIHTVLAQNIEVKDIAYVSVNTKQIDIKKIKNNIVWLTVKN